MKKDQALLPMLGAYAMTHHIETQAAKRPEVKIQKRGQYRRRIDGGTIFEIEADTLHDKWPVIRKATFRPTSTIHLSDAN